MADPVALLEQWATVLPDHTAVETDHPLTYAELLQRARQFAASFAPVERPRILLGLPQGAADNYAVMFGALLAGGCYTPIDTLMPRRRLQQLAIELQPDFVVAEPATQALVVGCCPKVHAVDPAALLMPLLTARPAQALAYIIFTSGSSGAPKGVRVGRAGLANYVDWIVDDLQLTPADRVSQNMSISFDASVVEIYGALCSGATLVPVRHQSERLFPGHWIHNRRLSVWVSVPTGLDIIAKSGTGTLANLASLRIIICGGESLLRGQLDYLFTLCQNLSVYNCYGPSEATCAVTGNRIDRCSLDAECSQTAAIGGPIPGVIFWLDGLQADEGELIISGVQVALGYLDDDQGGFFTKDGVPSYRTGDWFKCVEGRYYFQGRIDNQIKVAGFRIEIDEIERVIHTLGWSACVFKYKAALVCVVEAVTGRNVQTLRATLTEQLESFKVPLFFAEIEHLPRLTSGKLDRKTTVGWYDQQVRAFS